MKKIRKEKDNFLSSTKNRRKGLENENKAHKYKTHPKKRGEYNKKGRK